MPTWTALNDNQLVDHESLQDAVTTLVFDIKPGQTIPSDQQCVTAIDAFTLVDVRREILPTDDNKLPMKSELQKVIVFPPTEVGIVVVDIYDATNVLNIVGYFDTVGTSITNPYVYTGNNFSPDSATAPANCYILGGDSASFSGNTGFRFEFNLAKVLTEFPSADPIIMKIIGRGVSAGTVSGGYSLKTANDSIMIMTGSPGTYQPAVTNDTTIGTVLISYDVVAGANGDYTPSILTLIKTFSYDRTSKVLTVS